MKKATLILIKKSWSLLGTLEKAAETLINRILAAELGKKGLDTQFKLLERWNTGMAKKWNGSGMETSGQGSYAQWFC